MFIVSKILTILILPPGILIAALAAGIVLLSLKKRKASIIVFSITGSVFLFLSLDPIADLLIRPLEDKYPPLSPVESLDPGDFSGYGAIVVLGGGSVERSPEEGFKMSLVESGLKRAEYGARLARRLGLPLVYSSGIVYEREGAESESEAARRFWISIGIDPSRILVDSESKNTYENAEFVEKLLEGKTPILVTSANHMPRSAQSFRKKGMDFLVAPTDYKSDRVPYGWINYLPSIGALEKSWSALHEYIGMAYYSLLK